MTGACCTKQTAPSTIVETRKFHIKIPAVRYGKKTERSTFQINDQNTPRPVMVIAIPSVIQSGPRILRRYLDAVSENPKRIHTSVLDKLFAISLYKPFINLCPEY
ncbi:hypothetical protein D3C72_1750710 [compost metagenome]